MAKHSYEKARWNRREARQRIRMRVWPLYADAPNQFFHEPKQFLGALPNGFDIHAHHTSRRKAAWKLLDNLAPEQRLRLSVQATQVFLNRSAHGCLSEATHRYRKLWRRRGHEQERLHLLGLHDEAQELDPQPRRLGVMWDIW